MMKEAKRLEERTCVCEWVCACVRARARARVRACAHLVEHEREQCGAKSDCDGGNGACEGEGGVR